MLEFIRSRQDRIIQSALVNSEGTEMYRAQGSVTVLRSIEQTIRDLTKKLIEGGFDADF